MAEQRRMPNAIRVLLITGRVVKEHNYRRINELLRRMLESTGKFDVRITEEFNGATDKTVSDYDLLLINYDGKNWLNDPEFVYWDDSALETMYRFVSKGKGIVFYHSSFSLGKETPNEYFKMMGGGHNLKTGGRRNCVPDHIVNVADTEHPIMKDLAEHFMVVGDDFLPVITWHPDAQPHILATYFDSVEDYDVPGFPPQHLMDTLVPDGDIHKMPEINTEQPVAWTNQYGQGRAFTVTLGHDIDTMHRLDFLTMFVRGCEWAATGSVTIGKPDQTGENRLNPWPFYKHNA